MQGPGSRFRKAYLMGWLATKINFEVQVRSSFTLKDTSNPPEVHQQLLAITEAEGKLELVIRIVCSCRRVVGFVCLTSRF
jgi:hypothetical protein